MNPWLRRFLGGVGAVVGANAVFVAVVAMNRPVPPAPAATERDPVSFDVAASRKPPPPNEPPPPSRPKPPKAPPPPSAMLGASLAGLSFGLSAFEDVAAGGEDLLGSTDGVVMTESTVDVVPKPVQRGGVEYPARARAKGVQGFVALSVLVGEDGAVRDVQVLEAEPPGTFEEAAKAAVRGWRFEPGMYQGRPVPVRVQQIVRFALE